MTYKFLDGPIPVHVYLRSRSIPTQIRQNCGKFSAPLHNRIENSLCSLRTHFRPSPPPTKNPAVIFLQVLNVFVAEQAPQTTTCCIGNSECGTTRVWKIQCSAEDVNRLPLELWIVVNGHRDSISRNGKPFNANAASQGSIGDLRWEDEGSVQYGKCVGGAAPSHLSGARYCRDACQGGHGACSPR